MSKFIIGDTHGCYNTLVKLLSKLPNNIDPKDVIFLGDLIDRGPNSRKIINLVRDNGYQCLMGNHEEILIDEYDSVLEKSGDLEDLKFVNFWTDNGGYDTFLNYIDDMESLEEDILWMKSLPQYLIFEDERLNKKSLLLTHATFVEQMDLFEKHLLESKGKKEEDLSIESSHQISNGLRLMMWNRVLPKEPSKKYFNVSGHNIVKNFIYDRMGNQVIKGSSIVDNIVIDRKIGFAMIDTGSFLYDGKITCLEFPSMKIYQQDNIE